MFKPKIELGEIKHYFATRIKGIGRNVSYYYESDPCDIIINVLHTELMISEKKYKHNRKHFNKDNKKFLYNLEKNIKDIDIYLTYNLRFILNKNVCYKENNV